jgi:hypothetical protein
MEDELDVVLKDYVTTANSGKYDSWEAINEKFPELKDYDQQALKDYVSTANSGEYNSWEEINTKFPEIFESQGGADVGKPQGEMDSTQLSEESVSDGGGLTETVGASESQEPPKQKKDKYLTGVLGDMVDSMDSPMSSVGWLGMGDFIDDMARAVGSGLAQGDKSSAAKKLAENTDEETIDRFIAASETVNSIEPSDEMKNYQRIYEEEGSGFYGVIKGLAKNPSVVSEIMVSSLVAMGSNPESVEAFVEGVGTGTAGGAVVGSVVPGLGTAAGAAVGFTGSIPIAIGAATATLEYGATFAELLEEEIGADITKESVKSVLQDKDALNRMKRKAVIRGVTIGVIDALTGKLAGSVGVKIATKGTRAARVGGAATATVIEGVGGSTGEATARAAIGQEMDVSDIALEGIAEFPMAIPNLAAETARQKITVKDAAKAISPKAKYTVADEEVSRAEFMELIKGATPEEIAQMPLQVDNDLELEQQLNETFNKARITTDTKQAYPNLSESDVDKVVGLQREIDALEDNKTEAGKTKKSELRGQVKEIIAPKETQEGESRSDPKVDRLNELDEKAKSKVSQKGLIGKLEDFVLGKEERGLTEQERTEKGQLKGEVRQSAYESNPDEYNSRMDDLNRIDDDLNSNEEFINTRKRADELQYKGNEGKLSRREDKEYDAIIDKLGKFYAPHDKASAEFDAWVNETANKNAKTTKEEFKAGDTVELEVTPQKEQTNEKQQEEGGVQPQEEAKQANEEDGRQEEITTQADGKEKTEPLLEGMGDDRNQEKGGQDGSQLRPQETEVAPAKQVETLRAKEQAELLKAIPNIEEARVDGEVDRAKLSEADRKTFDKIYDKYDKLISPLLEESAPKKQKTEQEEIDNLPVVEDVPDGAVVEGEIEMKEAVVEEAATKETEIAEPTTKSIPTLKEGNEATVPLTENVEAKIKVKELPDGELAYSITIERDGQVIEDKDGNTEMEFLTKEEAATHITKKQKGFKLAKQPKTTKPVTVEQVKDTYIEGDEVEFSVFGGTEKGTILPNGRVKSKSGTNYRIGSGIGQATINENLDSAFQKGARQAIKFLDDVDKKLAKQSRETLGMNLPIAIAQSAVKVAKAAIKAGATVANAIEKAIQTVRDSDWYKNLSTKEQTQAEEDVKKLFNAPPKSVPTKAEAKKIVDGAVQQSEEALRSPTVNPLNKKGRQNIVNKLRSWFTDRQGTVKQFIRRMNLPNAEAFLINAKGASGYASKLYEGFHKSIYGGLKSDLAETLDRIIFLRRVVQIDDSRDAAGELRVKHPNNINREIAIVELENLKEELGDEKYNSLLERSDAYFDSFREVLKMSYKEGLIDEETYNKFKDNNYQPRKFIKYIFDPNVGESQKNAALQRLARENGVRQEVIKSLADGSTEEIFLDSRFLLQASINSLTKRIAQNKANRKLIDDYNKLSEEEKAEAPEMRQRKPIAKTKQGNLVYPQNPDGYSVVYYYEGGQQKSFFLQDDLYEQWYDFSSSMNSDWEKVISTISGSRLLKAMATGLNPLFIAANIPRDFGHILLFTDAYDSAKVLGVPILPINALKLARDGAKDFFGLIAGNKATTDLLSQAAEDGMLMDFLSIQGKPKGGKVARSVGGARKILRGAADMAAYLGEKSEIAFRLSVYRRQIKELSKEFKKENGSDPQGVDLENIRGRAAAKARSIIDFNQGGTVTKSAEAALPYISAATQGARVAADYMTNPKSIKDFMTKSAQAAGFVAGITLYNLSYGEEDWENVPDWEKLRYFIFLLPWKDKDGNREYLRLAKTQQAIPLFNIVEHTTESLIRESRGTDTEASYQMREDRMVESLKEFMPVNPSDVASRNPLISSAASYITNYDLYKDRPVTRDFNKVLPYYEGANDPRIEEFYKAIGRETGMSPARGKAAIEKIITSPTTNPLVGLAYAAGESIVADKDAEKQLQKFAKKTFEGVSRKFYRSTYPEWKSFKEKEIVEFYKLENATEKRRINKELKDIATGYFLDDKKTQDEKRGKVREVIDKVDPEDKKSYVNRFKAYVKGDGLPYDYFNISFEEDAEIQARLFRIKFGPYSRLNAEDKKEIFGNLSKAGMSSPKKMVIKLKRLELEEPVKENRTLIQKMTGQ